MEQGGTRLYGKMSKVLQLLPIGSPEPELIDWLRSEIMDGFKIDCRLISPALEPSFCYHPERKQYHSSELLQGIASLVDSDTWRVLGVTQLDLYVPILTFVFGEAELGGHCAVVSYHRLRQEFYGLPEDRDLLAERLLTESIHEIGHTLEMTHCTDHRCVMSSSHAVEWIDIKQHTFCNHCARRAAVHSKRSRAVR